MPDAIGTWRPKSAALFRPAAHIADPRRAVLLRHLAQEEQEAAQDAALRAAKARKLAAVRAAAFNRRVWEREQAAKSTIVVKSLADFLREEKQAKLEHRQQAQQEAAAAIARAEAARAEQERTPPVEQRRRRRLQVAAQQHVARRMQLIMASASNCRSGQCGRPSVQNSQPEVVTPPSNPMRIATARPAVLNSSGSNRTVSYI